MDITVRLFATLRQQAGWSKMNVELPERSTLSDLLDMLEKNYADLKLSGRPLYAAVNRDYADSERVLSDGDDVALFPPVSGGRPDLIVQDRGL
jgi:molybdopterin converting factor subunit 1